MELRNAIEYLKGHPEADRVFLLREMASGASLPFTCVQHSALRVDQRRNIYMSMELFMEIYKR
jgi:hypothetical protein